MKTQEEVVALIKLVQDGTDELRGKWAMNDLLTDIIKYRMNYHIAQYVRDITVSGLDQADLRQVFIIRCSEAIRIADINIGDPMMFILQKGKWAVLDVLRKHYRRDLRQYCHSCGTNTRVHEKGGRIVCPSCGATGDSAVERFTNDALDDGTVLGVVAGGGLDLQEDVTSRLMVDEFRSRLVGRRRDVFDLVVMQGFDRGSCVNYIREVADQLGVTQANVNQRLRQIRTEWMSYMGEVAATSNLQ